MTIDSASRTPGSRASRRGARVRLDWRVGGSTVRPWDAGLLGIALIAGGLGVVVSVTIGRLVPRSAGSTLAMLVLWAALAVPIVIGLRRSRPRALLSFRPVDLIYGVALGLIARIALGVAIAATGGDQAFPSAGSLGGAWWFTGLIAPVVGAPLFEEGFFRAVVLVTVFTLVRRGSGRLTAAFVSVLFSTGLFVLMHAIAAPLSVGDVVGIVLVALFAGVLVVATGRVWPAVIAHATFNATGVALTIVGTLAGTGATLS